MTGYVPIMLPGSMLMQMWLPRLSGSSLSWPGCQRLHAGGWLTCCVLLSGSTGGRSRRPGSFLPFPVTFIS